MIDARRRLGVAVAMWLVVSLVYGAVACAASMWHGRLPPAWRLPIDGIFPLLPWTLTVYGTLGVLTLWAALRRPRAFPRLLAAAIISLSVAAIIFIIMPRAVPRTAIEGPWSAVYAALHCIDTEANTFPSLHVAFAVISAVALERWWGWLWATAIAVSTLTTGQHVMIDVVGGAALGVLSWSAVPRRWRPCADAQETSERAPPV